MSIDVAIRSSRVFDNKSGSIANDRNGKNVSEIFLHDERIVG